MKNFNLNDWLETIGQIVLVTHIILMILGMKMRK